MIKIKPVLISRIGSTIIFFSITLIADFNSNGTIFSNVSIYIPLIVFLVLWGIFISFFVNQITITEFELKISYPRLSVLKNKSYEIQRIRSFRLKESLNISQIKIHYQDNGEQNIIKYYLFGFSNNSYKKIIELLRKYAKRENTSIIHTNARGQVFPPACPGLQPGPKGFQRINSTE